MLIDTHAHLNFKAFEKDWKETARRAKDEGVWMINVGSNLETSKKAIEIAESFESGVYAAVGLHPTHVLDERLDIGAYRELARHPKVVALGEVGLDYFRLPKSFEREEDIKNRQKELLLEFINLSQDLRLPLILHCRDGAKTSAETIDTKIRHQERGQGAHHDFLDILYNFDAKSKGFDTRGVIHCFSGDLEQALRYLNLDFFISFTGNITFGPELEVILKKLPIRKLLLETDCPFLTPKPYRGQRNEPRYVKFVAEELARIKGLDLKEIEEQTTENALCLFSKIEKIREAKPKEICRANGGRSGRKRFLRTKK